MNDFNAKGRFRLWKDAGQSRRSSTIAGRY
jgi:hypothetical protein